MQEALKPIKFIELFTGIGGFRYGLEIVSSSERKQQRGSTKGKDMSYYGSKQLLSTQHFTCVYANELDKYACQIYRKNFGEGELYEGDIRKVNPKNIPDHDLLTAGFPCQAFSIAGKRKGFADTRGTLFFEICRIAKVKQPRLLLLENVKGLLNHEGGQTFRTILASLDELGYDCQWQVLNSKNFGVPQNRERVFIVGHLRGTGRPEVFPIGESASISSKKQNKMSYSTAITSNYRRGVHSGGETYINKDAKIRRLTPTECERLQGFPDGFTEYGVDREGKMVKVSDTQRYKCLGNAVTTTVITEIGKRLI